MTGRAIDYSTTEISFYKFACNDPEIKSTYVGHTINFIARKAHHKKCCNGEHYKPHNLKIYQIIRANGGWDNWRMIEIESRLVKDKRESERIEQEFMEQLQVDMNTYNPNPLKNNLIGIEATKAYRIQYELNRKGTRTSYLKEYCDNNKEQLAIKRKAYYQRKKERNLMSQEDKLAVNTQLLTES